VPLAFHSLSHGTIAFGFFNIETDLLLLENLFFFAPEFCATVGSLAHTQANESRRDRLPGYCIDRPGDMGNLMGAIHGTDLGGFIGHVYRLYPFPQDPEDFKQKPYGNARRALVEEILTQWSQSIQIPIEWEAGPQMVTIADFTFSAMAFRELVAYVWQGGMPGWQDNVRPEYVMVMRESIKASMAPPFAGFTLEGP
jgi:hypothetical protein